MNLRRPPVVLALLGSLFLCPLTACAGANTDLQRGETNCDESGQGAENAHDASCQETGSTEDEG